MFNYAKYTIKNINRRHDFFPYVLNKLLGKTYIKIYSLHVYLLTASSKISTAGGQSS